MINESIAKVINMTDHLASMVTRGDNEYRLAFDTITFDEASTHISTVRLPSPIEGREYQSIIIGGVANGSSWLYLNEAQALQGHEVIKDAVERYKNDISALESI
ncbi:hypothetical protein [Shewanella glacialipiscicola]|uniref:hypothetical protein n=1 Tax=Shewanella glacialipiscicola TaxID=614069 RepID=UPI003D7AEB52